MTPEVSVLLPYRDAAATIGEALESVLAERDVALEVVAVDDGSRDGGADVVASFARRDARVVRVAGEGRGIVPALDRALARARGALLARMDADDVSIPGRIAASRARLREDARLAVVGVQVEPFPREIVGEGLRRYVAWQNAIVTPEEHARAIFVEAPLCHPSVTIRRDALDRVGGFREAIGPEDYDLWLRLDAAGLALAKIPEVLLRWRHHDARVTFRDPRCALANFALAKASYLARRLARHARPVTFWGAGKTGKRLARALEPHGVRAHRFLDIDPRKIGRLARGAPIHHADTAKRGEETIVVAVGEPGARDVVRGKLDARGFVEGDDYLCAS